MKAAADLLAVLTENPLGFVYVAAICGLVAYLYRMAVEATKEVVARHARRDTLRADVAAMAAHYYVGRDQHTSDVRWLMRTARKPAKAPPGEVLAFLERARVRAAA